MLHAVPGHSLLTELRSALASEPALAALDPSDYARDHARFEALSDQRRLIGEHLAGRLAERGTGPVSVLAVGCGDGSLDAPLAAALCDVRPVRPVRYVGVEPYAGSADAFASALRGLGEASLVVEVHESTFADAPVAGRFDVVTFVHSAYYVPDVAAALLSACSLLRPGGELLVLSAPRGELNALADVLAPPVEGHPQWFSDDVAAGFVEAGLEVDEAVVLDACVDLGSAADEVLDFTVQARLTPALRPLVRAYLESVAVPGAPGQVVVPHPVDVHRLGAGSCEAPGSA